jgi:hypothetical protein
VPVDPDVQFFQQHPDRQSRIRSPEKRPYINKQRSVMYADEEEVAFRSLGSHNKDRRRILVYKLPSDNPFYDPQNPQLMKIPMLAFSDETIEDRDDVLLPIIHRIMTDASARYGGI